MVALLTVVCALRASLYSAYSDTGFKRKLLQAKSCKHLQRIAELSDQKQIYIN